MVRRPETNQSHTVSCQETGTADCLNSVSWRDGSTQAVNPGTTSSHLRIKAFIFSVQTSDRAGPWILIYQWIRFYKNSKGGGGGGRQHPVMFKQRPEGDRAGLTVTHQVRWTKVILFKSGNNTARKTHI